jgi:CHAD domain-containing protein
MSFRLKLNEPLQKCVRRISSEQFDIASRELAAIAIMPDGVHQTRKVLKRLRALLRLIGPSIGARRQKAHNVQLRDIGRMLAGRREQAVLIETLSALAARAEPEATAVIEGYRDRLRAPHLDLAGSLDSDLAGRVKARIAEQAKAFSKLKVKGNGFDAIEPGLVATYRSGRKAFHLAYEDPHDDNFHELRKMVQAHWRHISLISRAWPEMLDVRVAAARDLSLILGDDHDLSVLIAHVSADTDADTSAKDVIIQAARSQQSALRDRARPHLDRLFAERPADFGARMRVYWRAAKRLKPLIDAAVHGASADSGSPAAPAGGELAAKMPASSLSKGAK